MTIKFQIAIHDASGPAVAVLILALVLGSLSWLSQWPAPPTAIPQLDCVVLLHGLGRTHRSMSGLAQALRGAGFRTVLVDYPSRQWPLDVLADEYVDRGIADCRSRDPRRIHLVAHSMGAILVRRYFRSRPVAPDLARLVMLGPPNAGSALAERLDRFPWFGELMGPAARELGHHRASRSSVPSPLVETAVIAGTRSSDPWFSIWIPGLDDGKVALAETRLPGLADFARVPVGHSFLPRDPRAAGLVIRFLKTGRLRTGGKPPAEAGRQPRARIRRCRAGVASR